MVLMAEEMHATFVGNARESSRLPALVIVARKNCKRCYGRGHVDVHGTVSCRCLKQIRREELYLKGGNTDGNKNYVRVG